MSSFTATLQLEKLLVKTAYLRIDLKICQSFSKSSMNRMKEWLSKDGLERYAFQKRLPRKVATTMIHQQTSSPDQRKRCLIVEDQEATCDYLEKAVVEAFPDLDPIIVRTVKASRGWLDQAENRSEGTRLNLALVDLGLPDGSGLEVIRLLAQTRPNLPIVVITIYDDDTHLFAALAAGASGYILKDDDQKSLVDLLRRIQRAEPPLSPSIARRLLQHFRPAAASIPGEIALTVREQETLTLLAKGFTVPEAAKHMNLSAQTVAGYVKVIYQKLHVSSRAEATREAIRRGLA